MTVPFRIAALSALILAVTLLTSFGRAQGVDRWQVLRDDPVIHQGLIVVAVGRHIQNRCDDISPRMVRAWAFAESLADRAAELGVARAEVDAFIADPTEQQRYRAIMQDWFVDRGTTHRDRDAVCAIGRDEISTGSDIGRLLRGG